MPSVNVSRRRRLAILLSRAAGAGCSGGGLLIFIILLSWYNDRKDGPKPRHSDTNVAYKYLPIVGLAISTTWNLFSLITSGMRSAKWLSNRIKLYTEIGCAIELAVLGYVGFIYDVLSDWRKPDFIPMSEKRIEVIGVTLLSLTGAAHLVFFCYGCSDEPEEQKTQEFSSAHLRKWDGEQLQIVKSLRSSSSAFDAESLRTTQSRAAVQFSPIVSRRDTTDSVPLQLISPYNPSTTLPPPEMPQPLVPRTVVNPHPFDQVPVYTPGSYGSTFHATGNNNELNHGDPVPNELDEYDMLSPRAAPPPPPDRKRPPRIDTTVLGFPSPTSNPPSVGSPTSTTRMWPSGSSEPRTPASASSRIQRFHSRSASSVSRLTSLTKRPNQHRRATSTPSSAPPSIPVPPIPDHSDYLPGGYVTNLELSHAAGGQQASARQTGGRPSVDESKHVYR